MPTRGTPHPAPSSLRLGEPFRNLLRVLARAGYPAEACGFLLGWLDGARAEVREVLPARNLVTTGAGHRYEIDPVDHLAAETRARASALEVIGVWHSHPDRPAVPSESDRAAAWSGWSYLIVPVTAEGAGAPRAWRLVGARFREEALLPDSTAG